MKAMIRRVISTAVLFLGSASAFAIPVTWEATGTFHTLVGNGDGSLVPLAAQVGDEFTFRFTFDSDAPDTNASPGYGIYFALQSAEVSVRGLSYTPNALQYIAIYDQPSFDRVEFYGNSDDDNDPSTGVQGFGFLLDDYTGATFSNDSLPVDPPSLEGFNWRNFTLAGSGAVTYDGEVPLQTLDELRGDITSLRRVSVPEPGTIGMLAFGIGGLFFARRRRYG
jgi:hypothetical protein